MIGAETTIPQTVEWAVAAETMAGETRSGDLHVVRGYPGGALIGVVDGLGHGSDAADSARRVAAILTRYEREPVVRLMHRCHDLLIGSRGAVLSLARMEGGWMNWIGVGNVRAVLRRTRPVNGHDMDDLVLRGGALGVELPPLRLSVLPIARGDVVVFATDGIRTDFAEAIDPRRPLQPLVDHLLRRYRTSADDALVLAARYLKGGA